MQDLLKCESENNFDSLSSVQKSDEYSIAVLLEMAFTSLPKVTEDGVIICSKKVYNSVF